MGVKRWGGGGASVHGRVMGGAIGRPVGAVTAKVAAMIGIQRGRAERREFHPDNGQS